jgi:hypothetical protein
VARQGWVGEHSALGDQEQEHSAGDDQQPT